ncbi:MAG: VWA domain-containing protein [Chloroflexi bacterium]|nr:VWA domain-containing protein [Chloroflexota bacterium]
MTSPDYYADLGIARDASPDTVRRAYHKAARELHPDVNNKQTGASDRFLRVQAAYEALSDPVRRAAYDATLPPVEARTGLLSMSMLYSRPSLLKLDEPQLVYVMLEFSAPADAKTRPSPPLNLGLVLDRSTSMQGERLDTVKSTAIEILRQLGKEDSISIITFSDRAEVLYPAGPVSRRAEIEAKIQMIQAGGGTEIYRGLEAGFSEVRSRSSENRANHILLLTDGRTYGDEAACLRLADQAAAYGISISGLGIGVEWNDAFLDTLAAGTGGSSAYLSQPGEIKRFMTQKVRSLGQIYAERASFDLFPGPGVELTGAFRISPDASVLKTSSPLLLGNVPKEPGLTLLMEFKVQPFEQESGCYSLAEGQISMHIPAQPNPNYLLSLHLTRPVSTLADFTPPPTRLFQAISRLTLYRMQEAANAQIEQGRPELASRYLTNLATHLFSHGQHDLARTALQEAENLNNNQGLSETGKKSIKYGTRALLLPAGPLPAAAQAEGGAA